MKNFKANLARHMAAQVEVVEDVVTNTVEIECVARYETGLRRELEDSC